MLQVPWTPLGTNTDYLEKADESSKYFATIRKRQMLLFGHVTRRETLENMLTGKISIRSGRGGLRELMLDSLRLWHEGTSSIEFIVTAYLINTVYSMHYGCKTHWRNKSIIHIFSASMRNFKCVKFKLSPGSPRSGKTYDEFLADIFSFNFLKHNYSWFHHSKAYTFKVLTILKYIYTVWPFYHSKVFIFSLIILKYIYIFIVWPF